jgi:F-type H+-transporting ATPase subunit b
MELVAIHPGLIIWTIVTFLALLIVLRLFAWKPLLGVLDEREKTIRDSLEQARLAREEAEKAIKEQKELLARARQEMAATIEKAQRDAEGLRTDILARAHREAEDKQKKFAEEIERQKRAALEEVRAKTVDLALAAASRLIQTELNDDRQRKLVTSYLDDLRNLTPS